MDRRQARKLQSEHTWREDLFAVCSLSCSSLKAAAVAAAVDSHQTETDVGQLIDSDRSRSWPLINWLRTNKGERAQALAPQCALGSMALHKQNRRNQQKRTTKQRASKLRT